MWYSYSPKGDGSLYEPYCNISKFTSSVTDSYETVLSISGKGFISKAIFYGDPHNPDYDPENPGQPADFGQVRITVDGEVVILAKHGPSGGLYARVSGFLQDDQILYASDSGQKLHTLMGWISGTNLEIRNSYIIPGVYPYPTESLAKVCPLTTPVYFKNSFLVEAKKTAPADAFLIGCYVLGGVE